MDVNVIDPPEEDCVTIDEPVEDIVEVDVEINLEGLLGEDDE